MPQCVGLSCRFSGRATIRGELALKRKHIIAAKARENQIRKPKSVPQISVEQKIDTQKELAKIAGVSHDTIARVHESGRCTLPFRGGNIDLRAGVDRFTFCRIRAKG
jgi:DNA-binding XRE family transcriptional regulator